MEQELGRVPPDNEIADKMRISVGILPELKILMQGVASLDTLKTNYGALWSVTQATERTV